MQTYVVGIFVCPQTLLCRVCHEIGVSELRSETNHSLSLAGKAGQQRVVHAADAGKGDPWHSLS